MVGSIGLFGPLSHLDQNLVDSFKDSGLGGNALAPMNGGSQTTSFADVLNKTLTPDQEAKKRLEERELQLQEAAINGETPEMRSQKQYQQRIDKLFADFDNSLPDDFKKYTTSKLTDDLTSTKNNIRRLSDDMHKLSELAGGDPRLEQQAEKITVNLLDRLKNDLGLTPEERKKLDGKSLEEIQQYYAETRSDKLSKLNETVNDYRQELHQLVEQTTGKLAEEKAKIYQDKLDEIDYKTSQKKEDKIGIDINMAGMKYESVTINDVKSPTTDSRTISERTLVEKQNEKTFAEASL